MKTILVTNQKGGVGKTTIADELAFALERRGYTVCFQNLDPQGGVIHAPSMPKLDEDDFLIVDTPPQLHKDFADWCKFADLILIPTSPSMLELVPFINCDQKASQFNPDAAIGVVINNFSPARRVDKEFLDFMNNANKKVLGKIPTSTVVRQAQALKQSVYDYKRFCPVTAAFENLADAVVKELGI
jgi:chromosome partitioning protein